MNFQNLNTIQEHLVAGTIYHFRSLERFGKEDSISQFQELFELVAFFFEDYRGEFIRLLEAKDEQATNRDKIVMEIIVFISWCSQHAFQKVKQISVDQWKKNN